MRAALVGRCGVALTDLRPVGRMEVDGEPFDALAEGIFVSRGTRVKVIAVHGNRIVVEPLEQQPPQSGEVAVGLLVLLWMLGLCCVIAELFLPSAGILSVLSAGLFLASIFFAYTHHSQLMGHAFLFTTAVVVPLVVFYGLRLLPKTAIGRAILQTGPDPDAMRGSAAQPGLERFVNQKGYALSSLRPSGTARIAGERVDVVTRGEMLEQGDALIVLSVDSNRVVVGLDRSTAPHVRNVES
jgi:membrane-bound serine protease (ClpP class)